MARTPTAIEIFLTPLAKLAAQHPNLEGQAIWWEEGDWQAQDDAAEMLDSEEIAYYAEGLLAEGFGLHWQVLAESDAPDDPIVALLFLWQGTDTPTPPSAEGWHILAEAIRNPA